LAEKKEKKETQPPLKKPGAEIRTVAPPVVTTEESTVDTTLQRGMSLELSQAGESVSGRFWIQIGPTVEQDAVLIQCNHCMLVQVAEWQDAEVDQIPNNDVFILAGTAVEIVVQLVLVVDLFSMQD